MALININTFLLNKSGKRLGRDSNPGRNTFPLAKFELNFVPSKLIEPISYIVIMNIITYRRIGCDFIEIEPKLKDQ